MYVITEWAHNAREVSPLWIRFPIRVALLVEPGGTRSEPTATLREAYIRPVGVVPEWNMHSWVAG